MSEYQPHQQRVIEERDQLHTRLLALENFLETDRFLTLNRDEQAWLASQAGLMGAYLSILIKRIEAFA